MQKRQLIHAILLSLATCCVPPIIHAADDVQITVVPNTPYDAAEVQRTLVIEGHFGPGGKRSTLKVAEIKEPERYQDWLEIRLGDKAVYRTTEYQERLLAICRHPGTGQDALVVTTTTGGNNPWNANEFLLHASGKKHLQAVNIPWGWFLEGGWGGLGIKADPDGGREAMPILAKGGHLRPQSCDWDAMQQRMAEIKNVFVPLLPKVDDVNDSAPYYRQAKGETFAPTRKDIKPQHAEALLKLVSQKHKPGLKLYQTLSSKHWEIWVIGVELDGAASTLLVRNLGSGRWSALMYGGDSSKDGPLVPRKLRFVERDIVEFDFCVDSCSFHTDVGKVRLNLKTAQVVSQRDS